MNPPDMDSYFYVALIDILGYKDLIENDRNKGIEENREKLEEAVLELRKVNISKFHLQMISDTIILSCENHETAVEMLYMIKNLFNSFCRMEFLLEGESRYHIIFKIH